MTLLILDDEDGQDSHDEIYKQYVRKKLQEANKEFEGDEGNSTSPDNENERKKTIKFSNQVVEVAPSPRDNYSETEDDYEEKGENLSVKESENKDKAKLEVVEKSTSNEEVAEDGGEKYESEPPGTSNTEKSSAKEEESVLIEIDGNLKVVKSSELEAENKVQAKPKPPTDSRPKSATTRLRKTPTSASTRSQSAKVDISHYKSPYALSEAQKQQGERQRKEREKREKERKEQEKQKEADRLEESEANFQCWRRISHQRDEERRREKKKKEEIEEERKREEKKNKDKKNKDISFPLWLDNKRQQKEKELSTEKEKQKEEKDHAKATSASRKECEKAFRRYEFINNLYFTLS